MNELEHVKKEKEGLDNKLTGFESASRDLDNLLGSQRSDKNKEGLGYNVVPSILHKPTPSIDESKCNTSDLQRSNFSISELEESSGSIMSKPMIKFVKAADFPRVIKTNNIENARKSTVKYAKMYRNTSKSPKVKANEEPWPKNNFAHKRISPKAVLLKPGSTPIAFFPPSKTTNLRNEIMRFQQRFDESFSEAWDHFNDLLRACPHHGFFELHQLDTFYNALNVNDQDSLNSVASGNFLDKMPADCLKIIESKSKVHQTRAKAVVAKAIVSHLEFMDVEIEQDDLNQKFLTSLAQEWLMYTTVWRNIDDLDTMSLDDVYNHLKVYELEVQKKSESNSQNMAFISSSNTSSGKGEVYTASVPTASTQVSTASTDVAAASLSHDIVCAYIASQSNGSQIKYEDITQIDKDDIEEIDIKWNVSLLSMRGDMFWKKTGKKITIQGSDVAGFDKSKVECFNCHKMGHFARECKAPRSQDRGKRESYKQGPKEEEPTPKALMAIDGIGWDWSYMANKEENHALVADDEVPTEFALMSKSSSSA
nr:ribonuclease H-like domain-containing protein [Tanacetum cinerariifolium]